jgi:ketosteroid isomerase-like protein
MSVRMPDENYESFVAEAEEAAGAYVRGDMERYLELVHHADEFTLLPPFGGPPGRHEHREDAMRDAAVFIQAGEARLEHIEVHAWGDTLVASMIERQHGRVAGRPDQPISLRVTHVYRRMDDEWQLVHRHADPLVEQMPLDDLLSMMRG